MAFGKYEIRFLMSVQDRTRSGFGRLHRDLSRFEAAQGKQTVAQLKRAKQIETAYGRAYAAMDISRGIQLRGGLGTAAMGFAAKQAADFDTATTKAASQIKGNSGPMAIARNASKLQKEILDQMQEFPASAQEMATAAYDIFGTMNVPLQKGVGLLKLFNMVAVAGATDLNTATNTMITLANNYGSSFKNMASTTETAFRIIRFGRLEFEEFSQMMNQVVPASVRAGQTLRDVGGAMAFLTEKLPSQPQVATAIGRLLDVFNRADFKRGAKLLGLNITKASGELRSLPQVIRELSRLDLAQTGTIDSLIPVVTSKGRDGGAGIQSTIQARKALGLLVLKQKEYLQVQGLINAKGGEFERRYVAMYGSEGMRWARMKAQLQSLLIIIGEKALPIFARLIAYLQTAVGWFSKHDTITRFTVVLVTLSAVGMLVAGTLGNIYAASVLIALAMRTALIPAVVKLMGTFRKLAATVAITEALQAGLLARLLTLASRVWPVVILVTMLIDDKSRGQVFGFLATGLKGYGGIPGVNKVTEPLRKWLLKHGGQEALDEATSPKTKTKQKKKLSDYQKNLNAIMKALGSSGDKAVAKMMADAKKSTAKEIAALNEQIAKQLGLGDQASVANTINQVNDATQTMLDQAASGLEQMYTAFRDENVSTFGSLFQGPWMTGDEMSLRQQWGFSATLQDMMKDMKMQLNAFNKLQSGFATLAKKGFNADFIKELRGMGADAAPYVEQLMKAKPGEVGTINKYAKQKSATIARATETQFQGTLAKWQSLGAEMALKLATGMESQEIAIAKRMEGVATRLWSGVARRLAVEEAKAQAGMNQRNSEGTFKVKPKVSPKDAAAAAARAESARKERERNKVIMSGRAAHGRSNGRTTQSVVFIDPTDKIQQNFNVNGIFLTEKQLFDKMMRDAAFRAKHRGK